tara:strand:- start:1505 stop:1750 length:246 start_codon:yes stop_codon:yes gene_type:complete
MGKWYIVNEYGLPSSESILVEERNDVVYERFITSTNGKSWKSSAKNIFHAGYTSARFKKYMERSETDVTEVTESEAFTIML